MDAVQDALKAVHDLREFVQGKVPEIEKGLATDKETFATFEKRMADLDAKIVEIQRGSLPPTNPLAELESRLSQQRDGLFGGRVKLPYERMLGIPAYHPMLKGTDAEKLTELQDAHDAVVLRYYHTLKKNTHMDKGAVLNAVVRSNEFHSYFLACARAGYATKADIQKFAEIVLSDDPNVAYRAGEILQPTSGTTGAKLTFTILSAQLIDKMRLEGGIQNEFVDVPLQRSSVSFPTLLSDTMGILGGPQGAAIPALDYASGDEYKYMQTPLTAYLSHPTFGQVTFTAQHILGFLLWNDDMFEDSVIPWLPLMRQMVARSLARAINTAIINGDWGAATAHQDYASGGAGGVIVNYDAQCAWNGLRKLGDTTKVTGSGAYLSSTLLRKNRANMGIWGRDPNAMFHLVHVAGYYALMKDTTDVLTVDKFGTDATVKTGTLAKIDGVDIKMNEALRTDLNTSGIYDNSTKTSTVAISCRRDRFMLGTFGTPQVEETRYAPALSTLLQIDHRVDFKPMEPVTADTNSEFAAGITPVSVLYSVLNGFSA